MKWVNFSKKTAHFKSRLPRWVQRFSAWHFVAVFSLIFLWAVLLLPSTQKKPTNQVLSLDELVQPPKNQGHVQRVNEHLKIIETTQEIREIQSRLDTPQGSSLAPADINSLPQYDNLQYRRFEEEDQARRVYEDLNPSTKSFDTPLTPEERINAALANKRWMKDYEEHQKQEYIRAFVENARSQGFEVQINDQLEVVSVKEIPLDKRYRGLGSIKKLDF